LLEGKGRLGFVSAGKTASVFLKSVFVIESPVKLFKEFGECGSKVTVGALYKEATLLLVKVEASLGFVSLGISAYRTPTNC